MLLRYSSGRLEYADIRFCAGISIHCIACAAGDLNVTLANKDCEVPFDIL